VPEDGNVPEKATIVEVENASAAQNMGRTHENRRKNNSLDKIDGKNEKFRKSESWH